MLGLNHLIVKRDLPYLPKPSGLSEDSLPMAWFLSKWLKTLKDFPNIDSRTAHKAHKGFARRVEVHRRGIPSLNDPWGWKNPRSMWLMYCLPPNELLFVVHVRTLATQNGHFRRS